VIHDQHVFVSIAGCDWKGASLISVDFSSFFDRRKGLVGDKVVGFLWFDRVDVDWDFNSFIFGGSNVLSSLIQVALCCSHCLWIVFLYRRWC
jgi:hypothetical protein